MSGHSRALRCATRGQELHSYAWPSLTHGQRVANLYRANFAASCLQANRAFIACFGGTFSSLARVMRATGGDVFEVFPPNGAPAMHKVELHNHGADGDTVPCFATCTELEIAEQLRHQLEKRLLAPIHDTYAVVSAIERYPRHFLSA